MKVWVVVHEQYIPHCCDYRTISRVFGTETAAIDFVKRYTIGTAEFEIEEHEVRNATE